MAELEAAGIEAWLARLLARRGVASQSEVRSFLEPSLDQLHDPNLLPGMRQAAVRLMEAHERDEKVAIVGDYDADGVSGTALLAAALQYCGFRIETIIPDRFKDGYGFQPSHAERADDANCSLIVTVDCGTSSVDAAVRSRELGIGVIVTDHHLSAEPLPPEVTLINPVANGEYPFPHLSGAGVAFKLAMKLTDLLGRPVDPRVLLRVACLGTIADLVPLGGENRVIAAIGLNELARTKSVGLRALMKIAGVSTPISAADIGYRIAPRLNAAGRLASADCALELLLTRDPQRAGNLARELDEKNRERKELESRVAEEAAEDFRSREGDLPAILVSWSPSWHRGVVGIAAGRLAREFNRPTILLAIEGDEATGSGRSIPGIHLHEFLEPGKESLLRFGGHAQAIGLSARVSELETLRIKWEQDAEVWRDRVSLRTLEYEIELQPQEITTRLFSTLEKLGPFGMGNREPLIRFRGPLQLVGRPRLFGKGHLSAQAVGLDGSRMPLLGWNWADRAELFRDRFEILGHLEMDHYRGSWIVRIVDCRPYDEGTPETARNELS